MRSFMIAMLALAAGVLAGVVLRDPPDAPLVAQTPAATDDASGPRLD